MPILVKLYSMSVKQVISIRLTDAVLKMIDCLVSHASYRTRTMVINNVLQTVLQLADAQVIARMVDGHYLDASGIKMVIRFEKQDVPSNATEC